MKSSLSIIITIIGAVIFAFTVTMIVLFVVCGSVPDTLITCVFAAATGECGLCGWIKTEKIRQVQRKEFLEDRKHEEKKEREQHGQ